MQFPTHERYLVRRADAGVPEFEFPVTFRALALEGFQRLLRQDIARTGRLGECEGIHENAGQIVRVHGRKPDGCVGAAGREKQSARLPVGGAKERVGDLAGHKDLRAQRRAANCRRRDHAAFAGGTGGVNGLDFCVLQRPTINGHFIYYSGPPNKGGSWTMAKIEIGYGIRGKNAQILLRHDSSIQVKFG